MMYTSGHALLGSLSTLALVTACLGEEPTAAPEALAIEQHDATLIRGEFRDGDAVVRFEAETPRPLVGVVNVEVGDATLMMSSDAAEGELRVDGNGTMLTAQDRVALAAFSQAIGAYLGDVQDVELMHASVLVASARYFAEAPVGMAIDSETKSVRPLNKEISNATWNDGKTCIPRGYWRTAYFDGWRGFHAENWIVGSHGGVQWNGNYACMGRCGAGCGSYDWTQDCLEHDACSRRYFSTSGSGDPWCGDEWWEASDDYGAFWYRCY